VLLAALVASGALSLAQGQDMNFDQRHYHFYLGWSLLAGRLDVDVAPAGGGTYLNPVLHVPTYLGIAHLPPRVFGVLLGALHGVNLFLVYLIALRVLGDARHRRALAALAAAMAGVGPAAVALVGTTFGDNLVSIPMLAAVLALATAAESAVERSGGARPVLPLGLVAASAALAGAAVGLKLTFAFFYVPLVVVALGLAAWARSWRVAAVFAVASALGYTATGGYWAYQMWTHFGNPLFPFANGLFHSPYLATAVGRDPRWPTHGWADPLVEAVRMATGRTEGLQEVPFADARYLLLLWLAAVLLARRVLGLRNRAMPVAARVVVSFWVGCYLVWLAGVHYYRYFAVGEYLAPAALLALLGCSMRRGLLAAWVVLVLAVGAAGHAASWGRVRWGLSWYRVRFASAPDPGAIVMVDGDTASFVLPYFPEGTRFLGMRRNLTPLHALVVDRLAAHQGTIYRLRVDRQPPSPLLPYGLTETDACEPVRTRGARFVLCRLERARGVP
jgi:hypothetical protein